jgi:4-aminobutyrate aminotransferase
MSVTKEHLSLVERDRRSIATIGKMRYGEFAFTAGEGCELIAEDGRRILDLTSGCCAASLGYGHPLLVEAVSEAVRTMAGAGNLALPNPQAIALAEELLEAIPGEGERRVWFGHAASDAVETAIAAIRTKTGRPRVITFLGGYHGGTAGSQEVSAKVPYAPTMTGAGNMIVPFPDEYRPVIAGGGEGVLAYIDHLFATLCRPDHTAAVIYEPILSDAGMMSPPPGFMAGLAERCRRHGIALVADEAKVGMGRTGRMLASEWDDVTPDFVILGKGVGGGLPLSAVIGPAEVLDLRPSFSIQTTHGNPVSAAAGRAVLRAIETEDLLANALAIGDVLSSGLRELADRYECIGAVRGHGLAIGVDLVTDRESLKPDSELATRMVASTLDHGAILFRIGVHGNVLQIVPPLTISHADAERALAILARAFADATGA